MKIRNNINLNIYKEGNHYWFNLKNDDGGTCSNPYGLIKRETLIKLRDKINILLEEK